MRGIVIASLLLALLSRGESSAAEPAQAASFPLTALQQMVGEEQLYTLDFLVFKNLAEGELRLTAEETPGHYRAELVARTLGVAAWLTGDRTQRYVSIMADDGSGRLRSISHVSSVHKKKNGTWTDRQKRYRFDYPAGKVYQERGENGTFRPGMVFDLPAGEEPVDILTGFYNLRAGVYGPLVPGARVRIPTFTSKGISAIDVEVMTDAERLSRPFFPAGGVLLKVKVDPEIFDTGDSVLYAWLDAAGRPARGIVENVIGLGDVYGRLRKEQGQP